MNHILARYLGKAVLFAIGATVLALLSFNFIAVLIEEAGELQGKYTFSKVIIFGLLKLPSQFVEYLPSSILIGSLVALGVLASNNEITVMRASGLSPQRILWHVAKPALLVMLAGILIAEFVSPKLLHLADAQKESLRRGSVLVGSGVWTRENQAFVRINKVLENGSLEHVIIFKHDNDYRLQSYIHAKRAVRDDGGWLLQDVSEIKLNMDGVGIYQREGLVWESELTLEMLKLIDLDPAYLSISELLGYANYLDKQGLESDIYWLRFWDKTMQPFVSLSLLFVSMVLVFGPMRQVSMGSRIFAGIVLGFSLSIVQDLLGQMGLVYHWSPLLMVLLPAGLISCVGMILLSRQ